ncbi:MAG: SLBB domain-containing protein [Candidatus Eiseniibacteriota bacterium]
MRSKGRTLLRVAALWTAVLSGVSVAGVSCAFIPLALAQGPAEDRGAESSSESERSPTASRTNAGARTTFPPTLPDEALAGPIDARSYVLGPGDVLSLELSGRASRQIPVIVDAEGRASFPEIGVIEVGRRTLASVRDQVLTKLRPLYSGVRVDLRLVRLRTFKVYVAGQVESPGVTIATGATRASEVFRGEFALRNDASRRNIELRRDSDTRLVDLDAFAFLGRDGDNPLLEDGDILLVPPLKERVYAFGAFGRSGEYELAPTDSISDLIEIAGGLLPGTDPASGLLVRFTGPAVLDSMPVDLAAALRGEADLPLQDRDRLFAREFPEFKRIRNVVLSGEFMRPGPYSIREGEDRLSMVIDRAGGFAKGAAKNRIQVFRPAENAGQRDIEFERLSRLSRSEMTDAEYQVFKTKLASQQAAYVLAYEQLNRPETEFDILLRDGDVVVVDRETQAVRVAGEVQQPSLIEYLAGRTGQEYIQLAGGFTRRADRGKIRVTRAGSNQTLFLKDARGIQPGDFIWVPEERDINFWGVFKDVILVAGSVATVIILLRDH